MPEQVVEAALKLFTADRDAPPPPSGLAGCAPEPMSLAETFFPQFLQHFAKTGSSLFRNVSAPDFSAARRVKNTSRLIGMELASCTALRQGAGCLKRPMQRSHSMENDYATQYSPEIQQKDLYQVHKHREGRLRGH
jgi:hypothetical protein